MGANGLRGAATGMGLYMITRPDGK